MNNLNPGYAIGPLIAASVTIVLIALVLQGGTRDRTRRVFLVILASLELWSLFTLAMRFSPTVQLALISNRIVAVCVLTQLVAFFHFCHLYIGGRRRWPIVLLYGFLGLGSILVLFTDLATKTVVPARYGYTPQVGPAAVPLFAVAYLLAVATVLRLLLARRRAVSEDSRRRYLSLTIAGLLPLLGAGVDGFTNLPPVAIWMNVVFCTVCTVAMLRYRLLDLHVIARRGFIRLLVSTLVAAPFVGAIILVSTFYRGAGGAPWIYAVALVAFALLLWPAHEWARRRVDRLFYSERYDYLEALRSLGRTADPRSDSLELGRRLTELVRGALRAASVCLMQPTAGGEDLHLVARDGEASTPPAGVLSGRGLVASWLKRQRAILTEKHLAVEPTLQNIPETERALLRELKATLLVPLLTPRDELSGILVVGPRSGRRGFSLEDIQLLSSLSEEAALSLDNARLYRDAVRARETMQAWLNNIPDAVLITDREEVIRFLNREGVERFGSRVGQRTFLLHNTAGKDEASQRFAATIRGREYEIASAPLVDPDGGSSTVFVLRDTTERKQEQSHREQLEARARLSSHLASIGEMASGIAHEINNPLTAVIGYSQLLSEQSIPADARESVEQILQGATRVAGIVQRLLTFARQHKSEQGLVNLNEVITSTLALRAYALKTGNIQVTTRLDPALPLTMADGQQLQQVLLNLIFNAETAMRTVHGAGELLVTSGTQGDCIRISVRDDGPGIPAEIQDRIFDPFFTTRGAGEGTGLGLSICHGIVSEHRGRIWVRSQPGSGAEFLIELPVVAGQPQKVAPTVAMGEPAAPRTRVLVVDDEPAVRRLLSKILAGAGHEIDAVPDGRTALEHLSSQRYGLVLLDVRMPGMSGIEVYEQAKRVAESIASRTIFLTGDVMAAETREFLDRMGASAITKPFKAREVLETIGAFLRRGTR
jgi:signal transduction histidine kinase/ActR/RegA family two-component response regulator